MICQCVRFEMYIYVITWYITSWNISWMVKELDSGHGYEGLIHFYDILNMCPKWLPYYLNILDMNIYIFESNFGHFI